jgi:hypothetical protein
MRFTIVQYEKAIAHLRDAMAQLEPDGHGCHCCGGSGHQAFECGHNPLVAMAMCEGVAQTAENLHELVHTLGENPSIESLRAVVDRLHENLHVLAGYNTYMGVQIGPARVVIPIGD